MVTGSSEGAEELSSSLSELSESLDDESELDSEEMSMESSLDSDALDGLEEEEEDEEEEEEELEAEAETTRFFCDAWLWARSTGAGFAIVWPFELVCASSCCFADAVDTLPAL